MFITQTESFCKRHCKGPVFIIFDHSIMQRFDFHDEATVLGSWLFLEKFPLSFFLSESQNKGQWIPLHSLYLSTLLPVVDSVTELISDGLHCCKDAL